MSDFRLVRDVVRRIECCKETGNEHDAEIVWEEFKEMASEYELQSAKELLGRD